MSLARFPVIQNYPDSEESVQVAAAVRAATTTFIGNKCGNRNWASYFWNQGLEITNCIIGAN